MFKNLPKDLLAAAAGVLDESAKNRQAHYRNVVKSALEQFKVQSFTQLSEIEQRIFSEWVVQRLDEEGHVHTESCGCGEVDEPELDEADEDNSEKEVKEEDEEAKFKTEDSERCWTGYKPTPGKKPYETGSCMKENDEDSEDELKEEDEDEKLSEEEEDEKEVNEEDEATLDEGGMPSGIIKYKQKLSYMSDEEFAKKFADTSDDRLRDMAWSHGYGKNSPVYVNAKIRGKEALKKDPSTNLKESVGSVSQVVWTSGAEEGKALLQVPKGEYDKNPDSSSLKTLKIKVPAAKALTKLSADRNTVKVAGGAKEGEYYLVKVEFTTRQGLQREDYASPEPSSAIGHRIGVESPKHADVIKDTSLQTGDQFRLMLQFVNSRPEFIPPVSLPGAPSVEALGELVAEYDDDNGVISKALADALDVPSERPAHRGNDLSESKLAGKFPVK